MLNELIEKYENKETEYRNKYIIWKERSNYSMMGSCEDKITCYYEILQDLKALREENE